MSPSSHPGRLAPVLNISTVIEYHNCLEKASVLPAGKELLPEMTVPDERPLRKPVDSADKLVYHLDKFRCSVEIRIDVILGEAKNLNSCVH